METFERLSTHGRRSSETSSTAAAETRKHRITRRLDQAERAATSRPELAASNIAYEIVDRTRAIGAGGIGAEHLLVKHLGLDRAINDGLHLLTIHLPYHESAWSLKAWMALSLPETVRDAPKLRAEKTKLLRMDFTIFRRAFMDVPAQIISTDGRIVFRFLAWNPWQEVSSGCSISCGSRFDVDAASRSRSWSAPVLFHRSPHAV